MYIFASHQVIRHHVTGHPTNEEQESRQKQDIVQFIADGGTLDKSCPGCGKQLSRQRNLIAHIEVMHDIRVAAYDEGGTSNAKSRWVKENVRQTCRICEKTVSRKSMKRHIRLNHKIA